MITPRYSSYSFRMRRVKGKMGNKDRRVGKTTPMAFHSTRHFTGLDSRHSKVSQRTKTFGEQSCQPDFCTQGGAAGRSGQSLRLYAKPQGTLLELAPPVAQQAADLPGADRQATLNSTVLPSCTSSL